MSLRSVLASGNLGSPSQPSWEALPVHFGTIFNPPVWRRNSICRPWRGEKRLLHSGSVVTESEMPCCRDDCRTRTKWYRRQARQGTLIAEDVAFAFEGMKPEAECRSVDSSACNLRDMFLGYSFSESSVPGSLPMLFHQLPRQTKTDIIVWYLREGAVPPLDHPLSAMLSEVMEDLHLAVAEIVEITSRLSLSNVIALDEDILERLLSVAIQLPLESTSAFTDAVSFTKHVVTIAEGALSKRASWRQVLQSSGLVFEAFCYAPVFLEPPQGAVPGQKGYAAEVFTLMSKSELSLEELHTLADGMPPLVRQYTTRLFTLRALRGGFSDCDSFPFPPDDLRYLHFVAGAGCQRSAASLLPQCRTRSQILAVMRHTREAGVSTSLEAIRRLLAVRPSEEIYVVVRATGVLTPLLFHAHAFSIEACSSSPADALIEASGLQLAPHQMGCLLEGLQRFLPPTLSSCNGAKALGHLIRLLPTQSIPSVVNALSHATPSLATWWASLYLTTGEDEAAMTVLQAFVARGILPDMRVLVDLLECSIERPADALQHIRFVQRNFPDVSPSVMRALVERRAARLGLSGMGKEASQQLLALMSLVGATPFPHQCVQLIASQAPASSVRAMLHLMSSTSPAHAVPLCVDVIERVLEALSILGLAPSISVVCCSPTAKSVAWWPSTGKAGGASVVHHLYHSGTLGLWNVPLAVLGWESPALSSADVHKALRLLALGGCPTPQLVAMMHYSGSRLLPPTSQRTRGLTEVQESILCTLACVGEALTARGEWKSALQLLPSQPCELPPLVEVAKLRALRKDERVSEYVSVRLQAALSMLLGDERKPRRRSCSPSSRASPSARKLRRNTAGETTTSLLGHFPPPLQKLVATSGLRDTFFK